MSNESYMAIDSIAKAAVALFTFLTLVQSRRNGKKADKVTKLTEEGNAALKGGLEVQTKLVKEINGRMSEMLAAREEKGRTDEIAREQKENA